MPNQGSGKHPVTVRSKRPRWAIYVAGFAGVFGILSVISGGVVLFVGGAARELAGDYVPFVVWFNFLAGFAYCVGAVGLFLWRPWVVPLAWAIAALTVVVFVAFGIRILTGGAFEIRTVGALALRSLLWLGIAFALRRRVG